MALAALTGPGWLFPTLPVALAPTTVLGGTSSLIQIDAVGEKLAMVGRVWINGKPTDAKTISAAGGGKIHFLTGSVAWLDPATIVQIGIQDLDLVTGPSVRPDGTFDVSDAISPSVDLPASGELGSAAWTTIAMSSGTKNILHGDAVAIVFHMTARGGSDIFRAAGTNLPLSGSNQFPGQYRNVTGTTWDITTTPIALIEFDAPGGELGILDGTLPILTFAEEQFANSSDPDECGLLFQVPRTVKADMIQWWIGGGAAAADCELKIYSTPLGTPSLMYSASIEGTTLASTGPRLHVHTIPSGSEQQFEANTDYAITIKATGTANVALRYMNFSSANYRVFLSNGAQLRKGARNSDAAPPNPFAETTTRVPLIGFRVSHDDDGSGGGGGGGVIGGPNKRANMQ